MDIIHGVSLRPQHTPDALAAVGVLQVGTIAAVPGALRCATAAAMRLERGTQQQPHACASRRHATKRGYAPSYWAILALALSLWPALTATAEPAGHVMAGRMGHARTEAVCECMQSSSCRRMHAWSPVPSVHAWKWPPPAHMPRLPASIHGASVRAWLLLVQAVASWPRSPPSASLQTQRASTGWSLAAQPRAGAQSMSRP